MSLDAAADENAPPQQTAVSRDAPIVFIVMGMAGSGKTTFVHVSSFSLCLISQFYHELCLAIDFLHESARKASL